MRRALIAVLLAGAVAVSTTKPAEARWGWGWGWGLGAFAVGALIGAALWRPAYSYYYPAYSYPAYGYGYGYPAYGYGYPAYSYGGYYGGYGGSHPSCLLAPRRIPRSPWPAQRFVASTASRRLQVRRRLRLALIRLSGYRAALPRVAARCGIPFRSGLVMHDPCGRACPLRSLSQPSRVVGGADHSYRRPPRRFSLLFRMPYSHVRSA